MTDEGELSASGVFMPKFFSEPLTLSSKRDRDKTCTRYIPPAPRPHHLKSAKSQNKTRLIHSRLDSRELDSSFNVFMQAERKDGTSQQPFFRQFFEVQSRIGFGSFGDVFRCRHTANGKEFAIKKSRRTYCGENDRLRQLREVQRVVNIPTHKNLVTLEGAWEEEGHLYLQMELCSKSLSQSIDHDAMSNEDKLQLAWDVMIDMLHALSHLHKYRLVHLDVKTDNILLSTDQETIYKLGDFGIVVSLDERRDVVEFMEGDSRYLAPEVMQGHLSTKADVFSLGLTILEIACNVDLPNGGELWHMLRQGGTLPDPCETMLPQSMLEVLKLMMHPDINRRPEVDQLLDLPIIKHHDRQRKFNLCYSYLRGKLSVLKTTWNSIMRFLTCLLLMIIRAPQLERTPAKNSRNVTPERMSGNYVPEIKLNDSSFSDDDEVVSPPTSSPTYASTPISVSKPRSSLRRSGRLAKQLEAESVGTPASRNLLKEFEAVAEDG